MKIKLRQIDIDKREAGKNILCMLLIILLGTESIHWIFSLLLFYLWQISSTGPLSKLLLGVQHQQHVRAIFINIYTTGNTTGRHELVFHDITICVSKTWEDFLWTFLMGNGDSLRWFKILGNLFYNTAFSIKPRNCRIFPFVCSMQTPSLAL